MIILFKMFINNPVTHRFACSNQAGKWLFGEKVSFKVVNNAIDSKKFMYDLDIANRVRNEFNLTGKFVLGHVGRFHPIKNHDFLIDIFKAVHDINDKAVLLLVGDGALRITIEKKVAELGLTDSVIFTGVRSDIPDLLKVMDVFVFPSIFEGLPVTLIEAQASGLKCFISATITSEVKITDLVEFISLGKSPEYWADRILTCEKGFKRRDTGNEIIGAGYDIKEVARWLENFYHNI